MTAAETTARGPEPEARRRSGLARALMALVVLGALFLGMRALPLAEILDWVDGLGVWGPVVLAGIYVVAPALMVPGSLLTLGAGALFGLGTGSVSVFIGATLGATVAFLIGRYVARDWVKQRFVEGNARFAAVDAAVGREGFKIVLLTRLSPVFPFNVLNYAYSLTSVSLRDYVLGSVGMIPGTVMYVYLGAAAGSVAGAATGTGEKTPAQWALFGFGLLVTVVLTIYVTKVARRALAEQADLSDEGAVAAPAEGS